MHNNKIAIENQIVVRLGMSFKDKRMSLKTTIPDKNG